MELAAGVVEDWDGINLRSNAVTVTGLGNRLSSLGLSAAWSEIGKPVSVTYGLSSLIDTDWPPLSFGRSPDSSSMGSKQYPSEKRKWQAGRKRLRD